MIRIIGYSADDEAYARHGGSYKQSKHLLPIDKGGKNGKYNLRPCCFICNQDKGCMLLEEWLCILQQRIPNLVAGMDDYKRNQRRIARVTRLITSDDYKTALSRKNLTNLPTRLF